MADCRVLSCADNSFEYNNGSPTKCLFSHPAFTFQRIYYKVVSQWRYYTIFMFLLLLFVGIMCLKGCHVLTDK